MKYIIGPEIAKNDNPPNVVITAISSSDHESVLVTFILICKYYFHLIVKIMDPSIPIGFVGLYVLISLFIGYTFPITTGRWSRDAEHAISIVLSLALPLYLIIRVTWGGYRIQWSIDSPIDSMCTIAFNIILVLLIFPVPFLLGLTPSRIIDNYNI